MQETHENKVISEEKAVALFEPAKEKVEKLITKHVYASMGMGIIPIPFVDFAGVSAIQLNLIRKLAREYNVTFSEDMVKSLIAALLGGAAPASFGSYMFSMMKTIPIVGTVAGIAGASLVGGASTYAVGKVFSRHFAEGRTFLTFDPEKAKAFYAEMFREGKGIAEVKGKGQRVEG